MRWVEEAAESLPDEPQDEEIPEITEIAVRPCGLKIRQGTRTKRDELQTFVGSKKNQFWIWSGRECAQCLAPQGQMRKHRVNHQKQGIILWNIGARSHESFKPIWQIIKCWHSFFYVTDGWKVYPMYIEPEDHLVSKTYMTRVEGENTRLRHYLARLHRKTLCYSKSLLLLKYSLRLLLHYLRFGTLQFSH